MLLDLDNFKIINDSCGRNAGDELLVEVARQLKKFVGPRGLVARLGGDEFVIVLSDVAGRDAATADAEAILTMLTTRPRPACNRRTRSLEIAQGALMRNAPQHADALRVSRDSGARLQIGTVGTGNSILGEGKDICFFVSAKIVRHRTDLPPRIA